MDSNVRLKKTSMAKVSVLSFLLLLLCTVVEAGDPVTDSLLRELKSADGDARRAEIHMSLSKQVMKSDLKQALVHAQDALHAAKGDGSHRLLMMAHKQMASVFFYTALFEQAIIHFERTVEEAQKAGDEIEEINNRVNISLIHSALGNNGKSIASLEEAKPKLASAYKRAGRQFPEEDWIFIHLNLGVIYMADSQYVRARGLMDTGIVLAKSAPGHTATLGKLLVAKSNLLIRCDSVRSSLLLLEQAGLVAEREGDVALSMHISNARAEAYARLGDDARALTEAKVGLRLAEAVGSLEMKRSFAKMAYENHRRNGLSDSAIKYLDIFQDSEKRMEEDKSRQRMMRDELMREFSDREARLVEGESRSRRSFWYGLAGVVLAGAASAAIAFFYRKRYRKANLLRLKNWLEARQLELDKQWLTAELERKDAELARIGYEMKKNRLIEGLVGGLEANLHFIGSEAVSEDGKKLSASESRSRTWEEFEYRFQQIHSGFYERLKKSHPDLTLNERRLCAFLKLDMTTKEISDITGQSNTAVSMARIRLRRKLGLTNTDRELYDFLSDF